MKLSPFFLLILALSLFQCQKEVSDNSTGSGNITISGLIRSMDTYDQLYYGTTAMYQDLSLTDSTFTIQVDSEVPMLLTFIYYGKNWEVFAKPGDNIQMSFDRYDLFNLAKAIAFKGDHVAENDILIELKNRVELGRNELQKLFLSEESIFLQRVDSIKSEGMSFVDNFIAQSKGLDEDFNYLARQYVNYSCANYYNQYPLYYAYYNQQSDYEVSETFKKTQASIPLEDPKLLGLPAYVQYLEGYLMNRTNQKIEAIQNLTNPQDTFLPISMQIINDELKAPEVKELMQFARLRDQIEFNGIDKIEKHYQRFINNTNNNLFKKQLKKLYDSWEDLKAGNPAPQFSYPDVRGKIHQLADYKGKYIYIDVWATWCVPCMQEHPYLEAIEETYKNNDNIVFMGVSIDEDKEAWGDMVVRKEMKGVQLIADGAWKSELASRYNIKGIPRFILIDREGKIISADAARPSSEELEQTLADLLGTD